MKFLWILKKHFLMTWRDKRGAVVTHGGTLPDSSQKTDFYSIIDNATVTSIIGSDLSAGANILDSQLATITTAGKVNTSALTGQIANTNLAQLVNPALVSGAALTLLPNIPSGAGIIPAVNIGGLIGAPVSKTLGQIYQALTDGIVQAAAVYTGGSGVSLQGFTDSSSTPSTKVMENDSASSTFWASITFTVKKGNYYEVVATGSTTTVILNFIPLGS